MTPWIRSTLESMGDTGVVLLVLAGTLGPASWVVPGGLAVGYVAHVWRRQRWKARSGG